MRTPVFIVSLGRENEAVSVEFALAEHVHVALCAVVEGLQVVVLAADGDDAVVAQDGLREVSHSGLLQLARCRDSRASSSAHRSASAGLRLNVLRRMRMPFTLFTLIARGVLSAS